MIVKASSITSPDVSRTFGRAEEARGAWPPLEPPLYAISRFNWSPESAEVRPLFETPCGGSFLVPHETGLQLTIRPQPKRKIENMTTLHLRKTIDPSPLRRTFRFGALTLVIACLALPPASRALLPPSPPDGGYPGNNTAEGQNALFSLTSGVDNTALGFQALLGTRPALRIRLPC
jgi:hypothetical protein